MNQITTRYVTENGACYEQYVITDAEAKTELVITPERGGMITGFSLNGGGENWTSVAGKNRLLPERRGVHLDPPPQFFRVQPPPLRRAGAVPQLRPAG